MKKKTNHYLSHLLATLSMIFAIFLDQYTKLLAVENLKNQAPIDIIENCFPASLSGKIVERLLGYSKNQKNFLCYYRYYNSDCSTFFLFKNAARETFYSIANSVCF